MSVLALVIGCATPTPDPAPDVGAPTLSHEPPSGAIEGEPLTLEVSASDPDGVTSVTLSYRQEGIDTWSTAALIPGEGDGWAVTLDGGAVDAPGIEYFFRAQDGGELRAIAFLPEDGEQAPFLVPVSVTGLPIPFAEDFELAESEARLADLGWRSASGGFRGYPWDLVASGAHGGANAAWHYRGVDGITAMEDWLISPPLDFSAAATARVTWWERGTNGAGGAHALYASTGSIDPADGDYVAVVEALPAPPEGEWGRSAAYDLGSLVGQPTVYLAWRYSGANVDDWFLDDVSVGPATADLSCGVTVSPSPLFPGGDATLSVVVSNAATTAAAGVVVRVASAPAEFEFTTTADDVGAIGGLATAEAALLFHVDASAESDRRYSMELRVDSEAGLVVCPVDVLVGYASTARVSFAPRREGQVEVVVGVGDPDAPTWSTSLFADTTDAAVQVEADITDAFEQLPPAAGADRWWARVYAGEGGTLSAFSIDAGGVTYESAFLFDLAAAETGFAYVPDPPEFELVSTATAPSEIDPGSAGNTVTAVVRNMGAAPSGNVLATLVSADADVTVSSAGPVDLGPLGYGTSALTSGALAFDVSAAHVDSTEVYLELRLDDGVESWILPFRVAVPFPLLKITLVEIGDEGRDGILDADEEAELTFQVTNTGGESCDGSVSGVLSISTSGSGTVTADDRAQAFGALTVGSTKEADGFDIELVGGAAGDVVDLVLALSDGTRTYEAAASLVVGEPPWMSINPTDDPTGDPRGEDFDIVNAAYRVLDDTLQIQVYSATVFDPSSLFVEFWGEGGVAGAADYDFYNIVVQSGIPYMRGYDSSFGFVSLADPGVSYPDATTVQFDIPLADMGLGWDSVRLGLGANWCGGDEAYCDHFPDGWGYPYTGWDPTRWFTLEW